MVAIPPLLSDARVVPNQAEGRKRDIVCAGLSCYDPIQFAHTFVALAVLFCGTAYAVDANRFMHFEEAPFGPYRAQVCDKFLYHHDRINFLAPAMSGEKLDRLLARCPGLLDIDERVQVEPSGMALYETDIDNDGRNDQVLYVQNLYRRLPPESYFKLDLASCRITPLFSAGRSNRLFRLEGRTYIESLQRCKGPIKILGTLRYLNCALIYESKGAELQSFRDELCVFIDRVWSRR
jgi:hypothetical protein